MPTDAPPATRMIPECEVKPGDELVLWCGVKRVTRVSPYTGPLAGCIGIAHYVGGAGGISLWQGQYIEVVMGAS